MEKTVIYEADVSGTTLQLYFDKPYRHIQGTLDGVSISFTEHSDWFIKYYQEDSFNGHLILTGYPYQIIEDSYCLKLNEKGKSIIWENPAIGDKDVAYDVAHWLADYYSCKSDYEYDTRGNPELEANDLISQENPFVIQNNILLESVELNYNGTFSGHVQGKRWEV